ncbi:PA3496 family putative envelope integrity protein [Methyloglobulus sp.]|uniref:PA3496 family putative envelope integrity protein n=1 Tax=Methyloglobulus sp. TaxID=2518622 RepID=UPI00398A0AE6
MTKDTSKPAGKPDPQNTTEIEHDAGDIFEEGEFVSLADGIEKETIRRDARRKIEIYWEKRRLREQFEDFDDSEFGF